MICFECSKKLAEPRHKDGAHTTRKVKCDYCEEVKPCFQNRHFIFNEVKRED